jgi:hypothetical protein
MLQTLSEQSSASSDLLNDPITQQHFITQSFSIHPLKQTISPINMPASSTQSSSSNNGAAANGTPQTATTTRCLKCNGKLTSWVCIACGAKFVLLATVGLTLVHGASLGAI